MELKFVKAVDLKPGDLIRQVSYPKPTAEELKEIKEKGEKVLPKYVIKEELLEVISHIGEERTWDVIRRETKLDPSSLTEKQQKNIPHNDLKTGELRVLAKPYGETATLNNIRVPRGAFIRSEAPAPKPVYSEQTKMEFPEDKIIQFFSKCGFENVKSLGDGFYSAKHKDVEYDALKPVSIYFVDRKGFGKSKNIK